MLRSSCIIIFGGVPCENILCGVLSKTIGWDAKRRLPSLLNDAPVA